jgi:uncharacterized phage infection (PIP) family protein YhgE
MNLVGKIFTVLICLFCVVLMAMSMVVYATHKNWNEKAASLDKTVQQERKNKAELDGQLTQLRNDIATEKKLLNDSLAALTTEATTLKNERAGQEKRLTELDTKQRDAVAKMGVAQERFAAQKAQLDQVEKQLRAAEQARDTSFVETVKKTDELHQVVAEVNNLQKLNKGIVDDLRKYRTAVERRGVKVDAPDVAPPVDGRIMVVSGAGGGLMEVSVGGDQGLSAGHKLEVYRVGAAGPQYLGRVEVVSTTPHNAAVKILPDFQKGPMQKGDNVTNSFNK